MKKIFISILSAAMFAACAKTETEDVIPVNPEPEDEAQTVYVEIGATTGSNTKATYDKDLKAYWEAGDQILAVQGSASSKTSTAMGGTETADGKPLSINSGEKTNSAIFTGDIEVKDNKNNRFFHFAYPSNISLKTTTDLPATSFGSVTTTTTCTYTVPSEQDGKWTPFLCTSTTEKTTAANITNISFGKSRNACFAVRVFETDGKTPKKIKSITITAENNIVGTISATTENDGSFNDDKVVFGISGGGNMITADNLQNIEPLNGLYEYRFEVLPVESGKITLTLSDESGSQIIREANSKIFAANTRSGVNVYWDDATISMDEPLSWYEDTTADKYSTLKTDVIYVNNVAVHGVGTSDITEVGVYINGTKYPENNVYLSFNKEIAASAGSGVYTVKPYAVLSGKGEITGEEKSVIVTGELSIASHTIRSSYNNNGIVAKNKYLDGDKIYATVSLNDTFAAVNLIESATLHYGGNTFAIDAKGSEVPTGSIAYQQYSDCYAEIVFKNGYTLTTPKYTVNVTGIPYEYIFTDKSESTIKNDGWTWNNSVGITSNQLHIANGRNNTGFVVSRNFYLPNNQNIETNCTLVHRYYRIGSGSANAYIGATASATSIASTTIKCTASGTLATGKNDDLRTNTGDITLTPSQDRVSISADRNGVVTSYHYIRSLKINYK